MKKYFGCGAVLVDNKAFDTYKYQVSKVEDIINIIIPHFDKFPLVGSKQLDYLDWKKAILYKKSSNNNINSILTLKNNMNSKRSFDERWNYLNNININLQPEWLQAFIYGEGCFQCVIGYVKNGEKSLLQITNTLEIAQNSHDVKVLESIKLFFDKGYLKPKYNISSLKESKNARSVSRLVISDNKTITAFVDKHTMHTRKHLDYLAWKELINLKNNYAHKNDKGFSDMISIKRGMNSGRLLNNGLITSSNKLQIIKWSDIPGNKKQYHTIDTKKKYSLLNYIKDILFFCIFKIYPNLKFTTLYGLMYFLVGGVLLLFTYSIFKSTYYGDICLLSVCLILALSVFVLIYFNIINVTFKNKHPNIHYYINILIFVLIMLCLFILMDGFYKDVFRVLMEINRILNPMPNSPRSDPPGNGSSGPGNGPSGPNPVEPSTSQDPDNKGKARRRSSSEDRVIPQPVDPVILEAGEAKTVYNRLNQLKNDELAYRARYNIGYKKVSLGDVEVKYTNRGLLTNDTSNFLLNKLYNTDDLRTTIWGNKSFSDVNVDNVIKGIHDKYSRYW